MRRAITKHKPKFAVAQINSLLIVAAEPSKRATMTTTIDCAGLHARTLHLVKNAPRSITLKRMSAECGLSISWISRFAAGKFENPGVNSVQALHDYLVSVSL